MTSPVPGFTAPSPRTWSAGDAITTPRLRGDMTNLAYLLAGGARPVFLSVNLSGQEIQGATPLDVGNIVPLNTWNVTWNTGSGGQPYYQIPLAGYWLIQGNLTQALSSGASPAQQKYSMGFAAVSNGAASASHDGGAGPATTDFSNTVATGTAGAELILFNTYAATSDTIALYGFTSYSGASSTISATASLIAEWVALPPSGTGYTGPYGTVVSSPQAAAAFPPGPGTTITNSGGIAAGATSMTVASTTGMITGGTLGLDFTAGQYYQQYAETVVITGISGSTVDFAATSYAHAQGAPVAVPISYAFMNQQCRDIVNFLSYPPLLRAACTATQSIPSQTFPAGTQVTNLSATIDTFSGFASSEYTVPVSGTYLVYGQVYMAGSTAAYACSAGISVSGGTINWGTIFYSDTTSGAQSFSPVVRRLLRLTAGQTVALYAYQSSGSSMSTAATGADNSRLICVWRST